MGCGGEYTRAFQYSGIFITGMRMQKKNGTELMRFEPSILRFYECMRRVHRMGKIFCDLKNEIAEITIG